MQVWQLKKINKARIGSNFRWDWNILLNMNPTDIDFIIKKIEEKNKNIDYSIQFLEWIYENPEWKESFRHLEGIENFDLKEYLLTKIGKANYENVAYEIFICFNFDDHDDKLSMFQTVEEWKTYVECIGVGMESCIKTVANNLEVVLKNSGREDRGNLIQKVMEYSLSDRDSLIDLSSYTINFEQRPISFDDLFTLFLVGYDETTILDLIGYWMEKRKDTSLTENKEIDDGFNEIIKYLKDSSMMEACDMNNFLQMLQELHPSEYKGFVTILKEIEKEEDFELLETCIRKETPFSNQNMCIYIDRILHNKENECKYRDALIYLVDTNVIAKNIDSETNMNIIENSLLMTKNNNQNCMDIAKFIENLPNVEIMKYLTISETNPETLKILYQKFLTLIPKVSLSIEQIEYYKNLLHELCTLDHDICDKIIQILNLSFVNNMSLESKHKLQEMVLRPENFGSLDYIYEEYRKKDNTYQKPKEPINPTPIGTTSAKEENEVILLTVLKLLEDDYDFDSVLDGFKDDDEITPKTLIRSYAYKNNEN